MTPEEKNFEIEKINLSNKIKHLDLIQGVINRMASNSFVIKGWTVTLVSAIIFLADKNKNILAILVSLIPIIMFWILDTFFLRFEQAYRNLYSQIAKDTSIKNPNEYEFNLKVNDKNIPFGGVFFSKTFLPFYLVLFFIVIGISYYIYKHPEIDKNEEKTNINVTCKSEIQPLASTSSTKIPKQIEIKEPKKDEKK